MNTARTTTGTLLVNGEPLGTVAVYVDDVFRPKPEERAKFEPDHYEFEGRVRLDPRLAPMFWPGPCRHQVTPSRRCIIPADLDKRQARRARREYGRWRAEVIVRDWELNLEVRDER